MEEVFGSKGKTIQHKGVEIFVIDYAGLGRHLRGEGEA